MENNNKYPGQRKFVQNEAQAATAQPRLEGLPPVTRSAASQDSAIDRSSEKVRKSTQPATAQQQYNSSNTSAATARREPSRLVTGAAMSLNFFEGMFGTSQPKQIPGYARLILFAVGLGTGAVSAIITQSLIQFKNPAYVWLAWTVVATISASEIAAAYIGHGNTAARIVINILRVLDIALNVIALHHANYANFDPNQGETWLYIVLGTALAILPEPMITDAARGRVG